MTSTNSSLLMRYKSLIFLSLSAQERDDVEQEDRVIDALDLLWSKMSRDERIKTEQINRAATVFFSSKNHRNEEWFLGAVSVAGESPRPLFKGTRISSNARSESSTFIMHAVENVRSESSALMRTQGRWESAFNAPISRSGSFSCEQLAIAG